MIPAENSSEVLMAFRVVLKVLVASVLMATAGVEW